MYWGVEIIALHILTSALEGSTSQGSSVSIVSDYGLDNQGSIPSRDKIFFF
jgi:hypothetical protein